MAARQVSRLRNLKGEHESYGTTIIKRQSSKTEREGTLNSGQLRRGADRPSGPNAVWNKQFRLPGNHQQHRGIRKSRKGVRCGGTSRFNSRTETVGVQHHRLDLSGLRVCAVSSRKKPTGKWFRNQAEAAIPQSYPLSRRVQ